MSNAEQVVETDPLRLQLAAHAEGALAIANVAATSETETRHGYVSQEFIDAREEAWVPRDGSPVWVGCGDEGGIDARSAAELRSAGPDVMDPERGYVSIFGQLPGIAKNILAVGIAVHGERFYDAVGGFEGTMDRVQRFMTGDKSGQAVRPAAHSDRTKEQAAFDALYSNAEAADIEVPEITSFCNHGLAPTGCAYCGGVGATSALIASNEAVQDVVTDNITHVFGDDRLAGPIIEAHAVVARRLGADFQFDRTKYAESGLPVMILEREGGEGDKHMPAAQTGALVNLDPETVGNAKEAGAYRMDVAGIALVVRRIFREYDLPANLLIASQLADGVAVRTVLAIHDSSGDHTPDPQRIGLGVRGGTIGQALTRIAQLERQ